MRKIYTAEYLLPVAGKPVRNAALVVEEDRVIATGSKNEISREFYGTRIIDLGRVALLPGLVNPHVHLELTSHGPRKGVSMLPFPIWLMGLVVGTRIRTTTHFINSIIDGLALLKKSGTTTAGHIATFIRNPSQIIRKEGIRAVIFLEVIGLKPADAPRIARKIEEEYTNFNEGNNLVKLGFSPHAPYSVSAELFREVSAMARKYNSPLSMHLAESVDELKLFESGRGMFKKFFYPLTGLKKFAPKVKGKTSVRYVSDLKVLDNSTSVVHCVQIDDEDIHILSNSGVSVIHCPRSNYLLNVGEVPLKKLVDSGINIAIGTDGLASNFSLSQWDEARFIKERNPWLSSEIILRMLTLNGAIALGMKDAGSLEPGKLADFISVDLSGFSEGSNICDYIISNTREDLIRSVWVGGEMIHENKEVAFNA